MKAAIRNKYGGPEVLELREVDRPQPTGDEVLVKVHCATVNRSDCGVLTGRPFVIRFFVGLFGPKDKTTGSDFAGEVVAVGDKVTDYKVGDRVFGFNDEGLSSHAEYLVLSQKEAIAKIPTAISYAEATASAEGAHYAYNFLKKVKIEKGDKVLVNGATGAIGSAALQLLKLKGAEVTAVCGTPHVSRIQAYGVARVIDYMKEDFTKDKVKYKFIADTVGKSRYSLCRNVMAEKAIYASSELGPRAENIYLPLLTILRKQRVIFPIPHNCKESLDYMAKLLAQGDFVPLIDRIYPLEDISEAYRYVQTGMKTGNVIIKIAAR